jgi:transposase
LIEKSIASVGLLVDILWKKSVDHLPLDRQEQTLRAGYGLEISRKTMCDWVGSVANWLQPIYH